MIDRSLGAIKKPLSNLTSLPNHNFETGLDRTIYLLNTLGLSTELEIGEANSESSQGEFIALGFIYFS